MIHFFYLPYCINKQNQPEVVSSSITTAPVCRYMNSKTCSVGLLLAKLGGILLPNSILVLSAPISTSTAPIYGLPQDQGCRQPHGNLTFFGPHSWVPIEIPTLGQALSTCQDGD